MTLPPSALPEAIALVEKMRAEAEWQFPMPTDSWKNREAYDAHMKAGVDLIEFLVSLGARYRSVSAGAYHLKFAGVATSCTGGQWGLIGNWLTAARRKV